MEDPRSLTQVEAEDRAALLDVLRYDLDLDLTGLADGNSLVATSTVTFSARSLGGSTFIDWSSPDSRPTTCWS
jgi:aminopeptidase N